MTTRETRFNVLSADLLCPTHHTGDSKPQESPSDKSNAQFTHSDHNWPDNVADLSSDMRFECRVNEIEWTQRSQQHPKGNLFSLIYHWCLCITYIRKFMLDWTNSRTPRSTGCFDHSSANLYRCLRTTDLNVSRWAGLDSEKLLLQLRGKKVQLGKDSSGHESVSTWLPMPNSPKPIS